MYPLKSLSGDIFDHIKLRHSNYQPLQKYIDIIFACSVSIGQIKVA
jgi:hypothetical protein